MRSRSARIAEADEVMDTPYTWDRRQCLTSLCCSRNRRVLMGMRRRHACRFQYVRIGGVGAGVMQATRLVRRQWRENAPGLRGVQDGPDRRGNARPDVGRRPGRAITLALDFDFFDVLADEGHG